jgi:hypothetical protein
VYSQADAEACLRAYQIDPDHPDARDLERVVLDIAGMQVGDGFLRRFLALSCVVKIIGANAAQLERLSS